MTAALLTLLQHAERQRDERLGLLARAEELAGRMAVQSEALLAYRGEYRLRHPAQGGRSASIELLRCHQGFMQRLDQAITQQQGQQRQADNGVLQQRAALLELQTRAAAVKKLIERRGEEARLHEARLEQRRSDDASRSSGGLGHGLLRGWRNTGHATTGWQHSTQAVPL